MNEDELNDLNLSDKEKKGLELVQKCANKAAAEATKGLITEKQLEEKMSNLEAQLKELNADGKLDKALEEFGAFQEKIKDLGQELESLKKGGMVLGGGENAIEKAIDAFLDTKGYKEFTEGREKSSGSLKLTVKDIVSIANSYTGDKLISQQSPVVVSHPQETAVNIRDFMSVDQGDPLFPSITFTQIYDLDRSATFQSENGELTESSFKMKEVTSATSRVGTYIPISNRLLKSRTYVRSFIMNRLPSWVRMAENFQILFGDGQNNNLLGIVNHDGVTSIEKIITEAVVTGAAGDITKVESYNSGAQTMIHFTKAFDLIANGQRITFANAPIGSDLLGTFDVNKYNDRQIMVDVPFADLTAAEVATITFTVKNNFFNTVEDPNIGDAVGAAAAVLTYASYIPNLVSLNPSTVFEARAAKDSLGRNLGLVVRQGGIDYIGGMPVAETAAVKPGYYAIGDFFNGASLVDYTAITIEFAEDVEYKKRNQVAVIVQEEVIMPVYNPHAFAYGKISDLIDAIRKV